MMVVHQQFDFFITYKGSFGGSNQSIHKSGKKVHAVENKGIPFIPCP
jgi:hypothetical protein